MAHGRYRADAVGYAEADGDPPTYRVDIADTEGLARTIVSLTPADARKLAEELVVEADHAEVQQTDQARQRRPGPGS